MLKLFMLIPSSPSYALAWYCLDGIISRWEVLVFIMHCFILCETDSGCSYLSMLLGTDNGGHLIVMLGNWFWLFPLFMMSEISIVSPLLLKCYSVSGFPVTLLLLNNLRVGKLILICFLFVFRNLNGAFEISVMFCGTLITHDFNSFPLYKSSI
jgi:hypothetical protein